MQNKHGTFILSHPYVPNSYTVVATRIILHQGGQSMRAILMFNSVIVMAGRLSQEALTECPLLKATTVHEEKESQRLCKWKGYVSESRGGRPLPAE